MRYLSPVGLILLMFLGCSSGSQRRWESHGDRVLGIGTDWAEDPVSGTIVSKKDAVKRAYKGTIFYFQSSDTASIFEQNPLEYGIPETGDGRFEHGDVR
jgi:YHS domain-containing protein